MRPLHIPPRALRLLCIAAFALGAHAAATPHAHAQDARDAATSPDDAATSPGDAAQPNSTRQDARVSRTRTRLHGRASSSTRAQRRRRAERQRAARVVDRNMVRHGKNFAVWRRPLLPTRRAHPAPAPDTARATPHTHARGALSPAEARLWGGVRPVLELGVGQIGVSGGVAQQRASWTAASLAFDVRGEHLGAGVEALGVVGAVRGDASQREGLLLDLGGIAAHGRIHARLGALEPHLVWGAGGYRVHETQAALEPAVDLGGGFDVRLGPQVALGARVVVHSFWWGAEVARGLAPELAWTSSVRLSISP